MCWGGWSTGSLGVLRLRHRVQGMWWISIRNSKVTQEVNASVTGGGGVLVTGGLEGWAPDPLNPVEEQNGKG